MSKATSNNKKVVTKSTTPKQEFGKLSFTKENFRWMIIGAVVIALGMILLSGGENKDPNVFDNNLVYSFRRITLAPIVILIGFGIEIFAILKRPSAKIDEHA